MLANEKTKAKNSRREKKLNNVQLSFESASVNICKNQLTNQIEEKAEYFYTREQKNPNETALTKPENFEYLFWLIMNNYDKNSKHSAITCLFPNCIFDIVKP